MNGVTNPYTPASPANHKRCHITDMVKLSDNEREILYAAADHRRAELAMNQFFDKVPKEAWKYV
ncbi:hypothetical protein RCI35_004546 [Enterobacter hormaechei]|nr:hypothetical protein [Enterobacter hormaechei]